MSMLTIKDSKTIFYLTIPWVGRLYMTRLFFMDGGGSKTVLHFARRV